MKKIKIKIDKKAQEEINNIRKKCGFTKEPIKQDYEMEYSFG